MVGTGGTLPFGAYGDHPEGVRGESRPRSQSMEQRKYRKSDKQITASFGTRSMQTALRNRAGLPVYGCCRDELIHRRNH